jgi:RNA polymerase sigma factor (sigma-70 family)
VFSLRVVAFVKDNSKMALTYEQLAPALYKQAGILAKKCFAFKAHELVAECWLMGNVQKLKSIKFASRRAYYDMIDYIRLETGCRNTKKALAKGKFVPKTYSLSTHLSGEELDGSHYELQELVPGVIDRGSERFDTKDLFDRLCRGLDQQEALILKLTFLENFKRKEVGKVAGLTESRISQLLSNLLPRIATILQNLGYENKMVKIPERTPRVKQNFAGGRNSPLYNRLYYIANKDRIAKRRKKRYNDSPRCKKHALAV